jgi:hypothetical protein
MNRGPCERQGGGGLASWGAWCVRDNITGQTLTRPATSEEAQQAVAEWNARCVTREVDPPINVDGWGPAGELKAWELAEDGWWDLSLVRRACGGYVPMIFAQRGADCCPRVRCQPTLVVARSLCAPS